MRSIKSLFNYIVLFIAVGSLSSCGFYKFNMATIDPAIETVSVAYFENNATIVAPTLSQTLSDKLRNKFINETQLNLVDDQGDFSFSGDVIKYNVVPVASQDNSTATLNRLEIGVRITLESEKAPKHAFESTFTQFEDFDATKSLSDVEEELIESISDNIVQEIFNKATLDW